jgi:catechol 2,3-dioxygenase-like lactoylglutathione lyase family enzyme
MNISKEKYSAEIKEKAMEQRLSIITLGVKDLAASRSFYERLGWEVATEKQADSIVAFNLQSFVLALYPRDGLAEDIGMPLNASENHSFTLAYNVSSEQEVDRLFKHARSLGIKIIKEPQTVFWGGYSGYFADPDRYLWEIAFNPYSKPKKDGSFEWV